MPPPTTDSPKNKQLDSLIIQSDTATRLTDQPLEAYFNGFHWRVVVEDTARVQYARGSEAAGVCDGNVIARGVVSRISEADEDGYLTLHVEPPNG